MVARSGAMVDPAAPPTCRNATSPSFVRVTSVLIPPLKARVGSTVGGMSSLASATISVPPRWLVGAPWVLTHSDPADEARACGAFPTSIVLVTWFVFGSISKTEAV